MAKAPEARAMLVTAALMLSCSVAPVALADDDTSNAPEPGADAPSTETAAETFRAGAEAFKRGDFRAAALSFEISHRLAPHGAALYNAGLAWESAKEGARAADAYAAALGTGQLSATQAQDARGRLDKLTPTLGLVTVSAPEGSTFDLAHVEHGKVPATVHLAPGEHPITVRFPTGELEARTVTATAAQNSEVTFEAPVRDVEAPPPPPPPPREEPSTFPFLPLGIGLVGGGAVAGGVAVFLGVSALGARDDFEASGRTDVEAHDDAESLRLFTNVAWVGAGVLAVAGGVLIVLELTRDDDPTTATVGVSPTGLVAAGRF